MGNDISSQKRIRFNIVSDKQEARMMLNNAESVDNYLVECHDDRANSIARRNLTYSPNTIPLRDLNYIVAYLDGANLPRRLTNELDVVNIIHLMPSADGGMPHTRPGEIICYPNISQVFSNITLIHELWHIHQRKYKDEWFKVFKRLGWSLWTGDLPEQLENALEKLNLTFEKIARSEKNQKKVHDIIVKLKNNLQDTFDNVKNLKK